MLTSQWYGISPGNISYTGGNVGIGTNNPIYTFDVLGIVRAGSTVSSSIYLTNSEVKWRGDGTAHFSIFNQNSTFQIRNTSGNFEPGTAGSNLVTVTTSGNVGVGVTTIGGGVGKLWSGNDVTLIAGNYAGDVAAQIMAVGTTNPLKRLALMYDTTNNIGLVQAMIAGTGTSPLCLNAAGGNVGIGSAGPATNLDVAKTTAVGTPAIEIRGGGGGPRLQVYGRNADAQAWMGLGTDMAGGPYEHSVFFPSANSGTNGFMTFGAYNGSSYSEKMRISVNGTVNVPGVITNPGRPMSLVGKNNGGVTSGMMLFNAVGYNVGSMYNSGTGYWTASVAGYYQFTYSGLSRITSPYPNMRWFKNGSDFGWGACHFNVGNITPPNHLQLSCSVIIYLAVNDNVYFYVASDGFYGGTTIHNTACCIFLG